MIDSDFILHYALYSVPLFWCGTVLYIYIKSTRLLQSSTRLLWRSTTFYFVSIILYGSSQLLVWAWAEFYVSSSGMDLGRALCLNFWYGLGPSLIYPFYKKWWAILYVGLFHIAISLPPISPKKMKNQICSSIFILFFFLLVTKWSSIKA